jgi:serine/threonine protein kinase
MLPITGGYRLLARLGSGSFGQVWRAEAPGGREVAVKIIMRPLQDADAQRELESLAAIQGLDHPYLVPIHQFYALEDRLIIVMRLAEGSLRDRLKECRKAGMPGIPPDELAGYMGHAAEALDYLHAERVLHRDIKPDNILLLKKFALLADFGLARVWEGTGMQQGTLAGTMPYMAPEVFEEQISQHTDQYSLAATYVELRLGRMLFPNLNVVQLVQAHKEGRMPDLSDLPRAEQEVLLRALAKDPAQRYPTCCEFHRALPGALARASHKVTVPEIKPRDPERSEYGTLPADPNGPPVNQTESSTVGSTQGSKERPQVPPTEPDEQPTKVEPPSPSHHWLRVAAVVTAVLLAVASGLYFFIVRRPEPPRPDLPPHFVADTDPLDDPPVTRVGGRFLAKQIAHVLPDGTRVVFRLVPKENPDDIDTFYIMRDKVSVGLFRKFAEDQEYFRTHPKAVRPGGLWKKPLPLPKNSAPPPRDDVPVFNVTWAEANSFAHWLGGELPVARRQWDRAGGRYGPGQHDGPYLKSWTAEKDKKHDKIAVGRKDLGPMAVGAAEMDRSVFGCRDMGGNGREWTRSVWQPNEGTDEALVPAVPNDKVLVELRGKSYNDPEPFKFNGYRFPLPATEYDEETGFRVVLEWPKSLSLRPANRAALLRRGEQGRTSGPAQPGPYERTASPRISYVAWSHADASPLGPAWGRGSLPLANGCQYLHLFR